MDPAELTGLPWLAFRLSEENGLIENIEAVLIGLSFLASLRLAIKTSQAERTFAVLLCVACFSTFFREVDFRSLDVPAWLNTITSGRVRNMIFIGLMIVMIGCLLVRIRDLLPIAKGVLNWSMWPLYVAVALVIVGRIIDRVWHDKTYGRLLEEGSELIGYVLLLYGLMRFVRSGTIFGDPPVPPIRWR